MNAVLLPFLVKLSFGGRGKFASNFFRRVLLYFALGGIVTSETVPEPATCALIFGLFAVGFVGFRRRK